jgi:hypothetical protein
MALAFMATGGGEKATAGTFTATTTTKLCNALPANFAGTDPILAGSPGCSDVLTPSGNPDITTVLTIPSPDYNFGSFVTFIPDSFTITPPPEGTKVGGLGSTSTLGLAGNFCGNSVFPEFVFYAGETDHTDTTVGLSPEGTPDRFLSIRTDVVAPFGIADGTSPAVTQYPTFLNTIFDNQEPLIRMVGLTQVPPGDDWIILQLMLFDAGDLRAHWITKGATFTNAPAHEWDSGRGYALIVVLQDPSATTPAVSAISDFCSPLTSTSMILGMVDADNNGSKETEMIEAPASGTTTHVFTTWAQSLRDEDGDNIENSFDTCPITDNADGDPRSIDGADDDMIDSACDPTPGTDTQASPGGGILCPNQPKDHDGDCFLNSQDNCPIVNNTGTEDEPGLGSTNFNSTSPDGGPAGDGMGNSCDANDTISNGDYLQVIRLNGKCVHTTPATADTDGDGWCNGQDDSPGAAGITGENLVDADRDGNFELAIGSAAGWTTKEELVIGTDPFFQCSKTTAHDAWPADFDKNRVVNVFDISAITPPVYGTVGTPGSHPAIFPRLDVKPAYGVINVFDISAITPPVYGTVCRP